MRISVSATAPGPDIPVDPRFGRAAYFMVYDTDSGQWEELANAQNAGAVQGAGIQAAQLLAHADVQTLISGHCGPKAFRALTAGAIAVFTCTEGTVAQALDAYRSGKLTPLSAADVEAHW